MIPCCRTNQLYPLCYKSIFVKMFIVYDIINLYVITVHVKLVYFYHLSFVKATKTLTIFCIIHVRHFKPIKRSSKYVITHIFFASTLKYNIFTVYVDISMKIIIINKDNIKTKVTCFQQEGNCFTRTCAFG